MADIADCSVWKLRFRADILIHEPLNLLSPDPWQNEGQHREITVGRCASANGYQASGMFPYLLRDAMGPKSVVADAMYDEHSVRHFRVNLREFIAKQVGVTSDLM